MITQRAFTYPFEDERWPSKFLVGSLLYLANFVIPILPLIFALGYAVEAMRIAMERGRAEMPEWDGWGELGLKGLYFLIISLVYMLPALILGLGGALLLLFDWILLIGAVAIIGESTKRAGFTINLGGALFIVAILALVLSFLLALLGSLPIPVAVAHYVASGELAAAFRLKDVWATIRANTGDFLVAWALVYGLGSALGLALSLLFSIPCFCFLIPILVAPLAFYLSVFQMSLFGMIYREGRLKLEVKPPALEREEERVIEAPPLEEAIPAPVEEKVEAVPPPPVAERPPSVALIDELGLSTRVNKTLKEAGITTVDQVRELLERGEEEILAIKGFGPKSLAELKEKLRSNQ